MPKYEYRGEKPLNREPEIKQLIGSFITVKDGYDRNHSSVPKLNSSTYRVQITGLVNHELSLSIEDLRTKFDQHEVLCCLQCAGNRRHTMRTRIKEVNGIDWFDGAVMNCLWKGPRLRDVLTMAGIGDDLQGEKGYRGNVACVCDQVPCEDAPEYGGSITLERAMLEDGDCILALEMNGHPLTPEHGAPIRALFPGILGARSVKWLNKVTVQLPESDNHYMQRDYKILPPEATDCLKAETYWDATPAMMDMPVNSIIGLPAAGSRVVLDADGCVDVRGYALPAGMDGPVVRVQVSGDGGESWVDAKLNFGGVDGARGIETVESRRKVRWAWCLWNAKVKVKKGVGRKIVSKAADSGGNVQPKECQWNLRGVAYNAWAEVEDLEVV